MRAFSLCALFGFRIERKTGALIARKKPRLLRASHERLRDELFKVLAAPASYRVIRLLERSGVLELVFPELCAFRSLKARNRRIDVLKHTLDTLEHLERLGVWARRTPELAAYLDTEVSAGHTRYQLLKLACLLHDIGKPSTYSCKDGKVRFHGHERIGADMVAAVARRLRLSSDEARFLRRVTFLHLRPGYLVTIPRISARARFRFFRDAAAEAPAILLCALADERATSGYLLLEKIRSRYKRVIPRLLKDYFRAQAAEPVRRLVDGNDIMRALGIKPSALVGAILRQIRELEAIGAVTTKAEALARACLLKKKYLQK
jgi:putative nucleotidyltransferase with HDIG domain